MLIYGNGYTGQLIFDVCGAAAYGPCSSASASRRSREMERNYPAARMAERLPGARRLESAFAGGGGFNRGMLKTIVLGSPQGGALGEDGRMTNVPA